MTLRKDAYDAAVAVAKAENIPPALLLTVVEVESAGRATEIADTDPSDGLAPTMLFERHVFLKELRKRAPTKVAEGKRQGLTAESWNKKTAYVDQKTSEDRLALLKRAIAVDHDCAIRACSLGLFQIMGHHAESLGFDNAVEMYESMAHGLIPEQIRIGVLFMRKNDLLPLLEKKNWKAFALRYNGKGYAKNAYDKKLAAAYAKYETVFRSNAKLAPAKPAPGDLTLRLGSKGSRVKALQMELTRVGYPTGADGDYGSITRRNVGSFQLDHGLTATGEADAETVAKLEAAEPIALGAREVATEADVKKDPVVKKVAVVGNVIKGGSVVGLLAAASENADTITDQADKLSNAADKLSAIGGIASKLGGWMIAHPVFCVVIVAAAVVYFSSRSAIKAYVEKKREGEAV